MLKDGVKTPEDVFDVLAWKMDGIDGSTDNRIVPISASGIRRVFLAGIITMSWILGYLQKA